jgi:hypothetical protein
LGVVGSLFFAVGGTFEAPPPFWEGFRPFCPFEVELLFLFAWPLSRLLLLECISLRHACWAEEIIDRRERVPVAYKDFSAVVVQAVTAEVVVVDVGFISRKRMPQEANFLVIDAFAGVWCCDLGLLQATFRLELCANVDPENEGFR